MRFVLLPVGTFGDVKPFLDLGRALTERGHAVLLATAEPFGSLVEERGLEFRSILSSLDHARCLDDPDLWHSSRFFSAFTRGFMLPAMEPIVELIKSLPGEQDVTLLAAFSGSPGARIAQELTGARMVSVWLDPASIRSSTCPPLISGMEFLPFLPLPLRRLSFWLLDRLVDFQLGPDINTLRERYGLSPVRSVLQWMVSPDSSLCLFPAWYARPQSDWPPDSRTLGFALTQEGSLPSEIETFLDSSVAPIAITFGTGLRRGISEFRISLRACEELDLPALVLAPPGVVSAAEIPRGSALFENPPPFFSTLLPRCRALIHHGGIGTVSQALGAGIPQLVIPFAHDQPDNARRLQNLGAGIRVSRRALSVDQVIQALRSLLSAETRERCIQLASLVNQVDGVDMVCRALEELGA